MLSEWYDLTWDKVELSWSDWNEDELEAEISVCMYANINWCSALHLSLTDCHTEGQNILFTDGEYINQIAASRDVSFTTGFYFIIFIASFLHHVWLFLH